MKKITTLINAMMISISSLVIAQVKTVNFDNYTSETNNDLTNNFILSQYATTDFISQVTSGGITGGAIEPSNSVSWANDTYLFCSNYINVTGETIETSISFKYNADLINSNQYERAVAIWLRGNNNNRDISFYVNRDQTLSITSYNYAQNTELFFESGKWYTLVVQYQSVGGSNGDEVFAKAEVFDLGVDGKETPVSIGDHTATIYDIDLVNSSEFEIHISGTKWGGSELLDNFIFNGKEGSKNCQTTTNEGETVNFDEYLSETDNDFSNNFRFSQYASEGFISQVTSGGITGGAIEPSNSISWGNDTFVYCSNYENILNEVIETSISFKYNADLINPNQSERTVAMWLKGDSNDRDIAFYLNKDQTLTIVSYNHVQDVQLSLDSGKWYKLVTQYRSIGGNFDDEVFAKAEIFDLGYSGANTPISIGSNTSTIYDTYLVDSSEFEIHLTGTKWGGSELLDDFIFNGNKGSSNCTTLSIDNYELLSKSVMYPNPTSDAISLKSEQLIKNIQLFDLKGRLIITTKEKTINTTNLASGNYIVKIHFLNGRIANKRIIKR